MPVTTRNMAHQQPSQPAQEVVEPYRLSEIFSIVPEYDGDQIHLNTFLNSCRTAYDMAIGNQKALLTVHIKNKLKGRASEAVNCRSPNTWEEIKTLLESHFGDKRDLISLIQDLQRIRQLPNESPLTFIARLQTHEAKMHASVHKQPLTAQQKQAQIQITEDMVLNTLLTGLEPKIAHIVRASNPGDMLTAITRVRKELQLNYFENQKFGRPHNNNAAIPVRKPNAPQPAKQCSFCKRTGHVYSECRQRQQGQQTFNAGNFQNFPRPNHYIPPPGNAQNFQQPRPNYYQSPGTSQGPQQQRPPVIAPNPNFNAPRPPAIQPNPNYFKPNNSRKTLHFNQNSDLGISEQPNQNYYTAGNSYENTYDYYTDNNPNADPNYYTANNSEYYNSNTDYYTANSTPENYCYNEPTFDTTPVYNQDFRQGPPPQADPPNQNTADPNMTVMQTQFGNMNLDNFNPNLNFPEQQFL